MNNNNNLPFYFVVPLMNIQQLCENTGCGPEDLPEAMNDREKWRERIRDIRACGITWWWWQLMKKYDTSVVSVSFRNCLISFLGLIGWGRRIHLLHPFSGVRLPQWVSWYDIKLSDGEVPVTLELWGMRSTPSLPSLPGPLWTGMVVPDRILFMSQIELFEYLNWVQTND